MFLGLSTCLISTGIAILQIHPKLYSIIDYIITQNLNREITSKLIFLWVTLAAFFKSLSWKINKKMSTLFKIAYHFSYSQIMGL